jgi:sugar O-acyltransferase (sialic acid O-acetyltransferase NeuD family)
MGDYVLVGGGSFAREVYDWYTPGFAETGSRFIGYLDDGNHPMKGFGGLPQLGTIKAYVPDARHELVMAIGAPGGKRAVAERLLALGARFATLIHSRAWIGASARVGRGVLAGPFAGAAAGADIGNFVTQGGYAGIGHDVSVGDYCTLSSHVDLTGGVQVGSDVFFGSGARVLPKLKIGRGCQIGAGAVVVRSVPDGVTLYAAPARRL